MKTAHRETFGGKAMVLLGACMSLVGGPATRAADSVASTTAIVPPQGIETNVNHAGIIRAWNRETLARGEKLYTMMCLPCHGTPQQPGSLPASRAFWKEPFKNGTDPLSLYKTLTHGLGQMPAWPFVSPEQRYDVIHYIRETFMRLNNPAAYFRISDPYLAGLPKSTGTFTKTAEMIEFEKGPKYQRMDFGPALFWTLQVATNNIAYKGIAVRLDDGPGGISKGRAWMLYDHDTMRVAAGWSGDQFVDWKGIAFDGSHGTHTSIVGEKAFINPVGPGWANPQTGRFDDPRLRGRDGKPYGPLPREWTHYKGLYLHGHKVVIAYTVGDAEVLEVPACEQGSGRGLIYSRALKVGRSSRDLLLRVAPQTVSVRIEGPNTARLVQKEGFHLLSIPASATPVKVKVRIESPVHPAASSDAPPILAHEMRTGDEFDSLTKGGPPRWNLEATTRGELGADNQAFAVDTIPYPEGDQNPWHSWMRLGGFDFFADGKRAAVCTWNGDVWLASGIEGDLKEVKWKRIASGLFQPLGVKIVAETIYVTCRDQIARLRDLNGDEEIDFIENFNNDHQVTEHFHEFAMGLQTDAQGNFYYAKSARHALPALIPHHGTLLKVSQDGSKTEIVASGFRAANGVCVNDDGTFFVTDQEGHWTPKNRINLVKPGKFYGNMWAYDVPASNADSAMEQPLVWITNDRDRSPGEVVRVTSDQWGPLKDSLLNLSYGTGRIFVVPFEKVKGQVQGGVVELPIADLPSGVMRGRFHPQNGQLYACGMFAWAGNRTRDGGFYRVRHTGKPITMPIGFHATTKGVELKFASPVDAKSAA
ncbi:MAG: c-type cytochrome, partial [Akkermansiaceae bacterium]|nr:c-type cytochrome [Verrucomicrobiales bacterium]